MSNKIETEMATKGYQKVSGMAVVGDVVVTETTTKVLSAILNTEQAVNVFNDEFSDGWQLYRKTSNALTI